MKTFSKLILVAAMSALVASSAVAERLSVPLTGAQLVTNLDGRVRVVLPCSSPVLPTPISLGDAWLKLPGLPLSAARDLRVHVLAVRGPWAPGGEIPVHEGLVGRLSLPAGSPARGIDVANLVRGVLSGAELYGLLVTVPEGSGTGFDGLDAPLLLAAFQQAVLEIWYRRIPPPPRRAQ